MTVYPRILVACFFIVGIHGELASVNAQSERVDMPGKERARSVGSLTVDQARREVNAARKNLKDHLRSAVESDAQLAQSQKFRYELEAAELRLKQAELRQADVPDEVKLVLNRDLETALAETGVKFATDVYETVKRLQARGTKSKQDLKRALYDVKASKLELERAKIAAADLSDDQRKRKFAQLDVDVADLDFEHARSDYELVKRLYKKSSVSKQQLLYAHYLAKTAKIDWLSARVTASDQSEIKKRFQLVDLALEKARAKNRFLKFVHEANQSLFKKGRISKERYLRSLEGFRKSELELEAAQAAAVSEVDT